MLKHLALFAAVLLTAPSAFAAEARTMCVFDPSGKAGDAYRITADYARAAVDWGVDLTLKVHTDEAIALSDLKAGECHAAVLTGVTARELVRFTTTLEAMGAVTSYEQLKKAIGLLTDERLAPMQKSNGYESVGVFGAGAVYIYTRDRAVDTIEELPGKKVSTIRSDPAARFMVDDVGAQAILAEVSTFAGMFNEGQVDISYAPATAYEPLELGKGIGTTGGLIKYPLSMLTLQVVTRDDAAFPANFAAGSRRWAVDNFDSILSTVRRLEGKVPADQWITIPADAKVKYDERFRRVREHLVGEKIYDSTMLQLLDRLR